MVVVARPPEQPAAAGEPAEERAEAGEDHPEPEAPRASSEEADGGRDG